MRALPVLLLLLQFGTPPDARHSPVQDAFVATALQRLQAARIPARNLADLEQQAEHLRRMRGNPFDPFQTPADREAYRAAYDRLAEDITLFAKRYGVSCELTVITPVAGAEIKYQTLGERANGRRARSARRPTTVRFRIPIGRYHVWTERDGVPTSNVSNVYELVASQDTLILSERRRY